MTVFLTHDREPFYCGTYFPREHFDRLVEAVATAWSDHRGDVTGQARQIAAALAETSARGRRAAAGARVGGGARRRRPSWLMPRSTALARRYDSARGGFGGAPKFPPSHGARVPAAAVGAERRADRRGRRSRRSAMASGHARGDGQGRHLRPARRRIRQVQRRRGLGGAALREDAVRQRAAGEGLRALVAALAG